MRQREVNLPLSHLDIQVHDVLPEGEGAVLRHSEERLGRLVLQGGGAQVQVGLAPRLGDPW